MAHQPEFIIGHYDKNWSNLCQELNTIVDQEISVKTPLDSSENSKITSKSKVFISGHQHNLQNLFFSLDSSSIPKDKEKIGFRNCTCIKVFLPKDQNDRSVEKLGETGVKHEINEGMTESNQPNEQLSVEIISTPDHGDDDKQEYFYLEKGDIGKYLKDNRFLTEKPVVDFFKKIDSLYMIRHGQALHNYRDLLLERKSDTLNLRGELPLTKKIPNLEGVYLNSCLTTRGLEQALDLYTNLKSEGVFFNKDIGDVLITSPMDRTIQTLLNAVTDSTKYTTIKKRFISMYRLRFPLDSRIILHQMLYNKKNNNNSDGPGEMKCSTPLDYLNLFRKLEIGSEVSYDELGGKRTISKTLKKKSTRRHNRRKLVSTSKKILQKKRTRVKNYPLKKLKSVSHKK